MFLLRAALLVLLQPHIGASEPTKADASIDGQPYKIDFFLPTSGFKAALVLLHGGGGTKEGMAESLKIDATWANTNNLVVALPQGFSNVPDKKQYTWSNHVMKSGKDDLAFLKQLSSYLRKEYDVSRVFLAGHSNGGMMANRVWCEASEAYDMFVTIAGPPSVVYAMQAKDVPQPFLPTPCSSPKAKAKPLLAIIGDADTVLQTNLNFTALLWQVKPLLVRSSKASWEGQNLETPNPDPVYLLNDLVSLQQRRAVLDCGAPVPLGSPNMSVGQKMTGRNAEWTAFSECGGRQQVMQVHGMDHTLPEINTMIDVKAQLIRFFFAASEDPETSAGTRPETSAGTRPATYVCGFALLCVTSVLGYIM